MIWRCHALLLILLSANALADFDSQYLQGLGDSRYEKLYSEVVDRDFHIYVQLPASYAESEEATYPVVYILDGGSLFPLFAAYGRYLRFGEELPDVILVGISYGSSDFESGNYRSTDFTAPSEEREFWGGAKEFQAFLETELLPQIESDYRARADRRIVFGQSLGGQFVLFSALTRPDLFWGHIASNPALHRNLPFFLQNHAAAGDAAPTARVFFASGTLDDPRFRQPAEAWIEHWSNTAAPWRLKTMDLEGHTHMSAPPASYRQGMLWLFSSDATQQP